MDSNLTESDIINMDDDDLNKNNNLEQNNLINNINDKVNKIETQETQETQETEETEETEDTTDTDDNKEDKSNTKDNEDESDKSNQNNLNPIENEINKAKYNLANGIPLTDDQKILLSSNSSRVFKKILIPLIIIGVLFLIHIIFLFIPSKNTSNNNYEKIDIIKPVKVQRIKQLK